jgi:hypothetical protein
LFDECHDLVLKLNTREECEEVVIELDVVDMVEEHKEIPIELNIMETTEEGKEVSFKLNVVEDEEAPPNCEVLK